MQRLLNGLLRILGIVIVAIGCSFYFLGINTTAQFFAGVTSFLFNDNTLITDLAGANVDSEFRFYSVFWITFGLFVIHTAKNLPQHMERVPLLLLIFFMGGVGRLMSYFAVGEPHILFMVLLYVELLLPLLLMLIWLGARKTLK